jgi:hypothetical protein
MNNDLNGNNKSPKVMNKSSISSYTRLRGNAYDEVEFKESCENKKYM